MALPLDYAPLRTPAAPPADDPGIDAGVIEDARARRRRHRRIGTLLLLAALAGAGLIAGMSGGGGAGGAGTGHPGSSGSGPGAGSGHAGASRGFPGAPVTQAGGDGVETDACPLAPASRYLPARSGCVTVRRADLDGEGRADLILVYSRLSREHVSGYVGGTPPELRPDYFAKAAFLTVVLADGSTVSTRIPGARAAAIDSVAHVGDDPGSEVFLETQRISSGADAVAYGEHDGRLIPAGATLAYGGDSATDADFQCVPGDPPRLIQRTFELIGPTMYGSWRETRVVYAWHGPTLRRISTRTFRHHGDPELGRVARTGDGRGCATSVR